MYGSLEVVEKLPLGFVHGEVFADLVGVAEVGGEGLEEGLLVVGFFLFFFESGKGLSFALDAGELVARLGLCVIVSEREGRFTKDWTLIDING